MLAKAQKGLKRKARVLKGNENQPRAANNPVYHSSVPIHTQGPKRLSDLFKVT